MTERTLWGIHAGKTGDADTLFLKQKRVALGWADMGDLTKLKPDREAFKARVAHCYPDAKPGAIPNYAGQLFRFVHEMKSGDFVAYPSKQARKIYLGRVTGNYKYDPTRNPGYPNTRSVEWLRDVPRTTFSQGALHEIGSAMSFFQIKNYAEEFYAAIDGKPVAPSVQQDDTVGLVAEEIEETTRVLFSKHWPSSSKAMRSHTLSGTCSSGWDTTRAFRQKAQTEVSTSSRTKTNWASSRQSSRCR